MGFNWAIITTANRLKTPLLVFSLTLTSTTFAATKINTHSLCKVLISRASNEDHTQPSSQSHKLAPSVLLPGWFKGTSSEQSEISAKIKSALQEESASHIGSGNQETLAKFFAGHGKPLARGADKNEFRFGKISSEEDQAIQDIISAAKIEDKIRDRRGEGDEDFKNENIAILNAIERIQSRKIVSDSDVEAIKKLRTRLKSFRGTVSHLNHRSDAEGKLDILVYDYLTYNNSLIRKELASLRKSQSLSLAIPKIVEKNGEVTLDFDIKNFESSIKYDAFLDQRRTLANDANRVKKAQKKYAEEYLFTRALASRLEETDENKIIYSFDDHMSEDELRRKSDIENLRNESKLALSLNQAIHPNLEALKPKKIKSTLKDVSHFSLKYGAIGISALALMFSQFDLYEKTRDKVIMPYFTSKEDNEDEENAYNTQYWIKKCSAENSFAKVDACLEDFRQILTNALKEESKQNKAKNPKHSDIVEKKKFDDLYVSVTNAVYDELNFDLYSEVNSAETKRYAKERSYKAATKKSLEEQEKTEQAQKLDETSNELLLPTTFTMHSLNEKLDKLLKDMNDYEVKYKINLQSSRETPELIAENTLKHYSYLRNVATRLEYLNSIQPVDANPQQTNEFRARISEKLSSVEDEHGTMTSNLIKQLGKLSLVELTSQSEKPETNLNDKKVDPAQPADQQQPAASTTSQP